MLNVKDLDLGGFGFQFFLFYRSCCEKGWAGLRVELNVQGFEDLKFSSWGGCCEFIL